MTDRRVDLLPCDDGALWHRHSQKCLDLLGSRLPVPPAGWQWNWGRVGNGYGVWLQVDKVEELEHMNLVLVDRSWHLFGYGSMKSVGDLAHLMHAVTVGATLPNLK